MRTHSPKNLAIRAIRKLRLKSRTGTGLLSSMFEEGGFLFFHFYYPPAGQSGEYFRWKEIMCFLSLEYPGRWRKLLVHHGEQQSVQGDKSIGQQIDGDVALKNSLRRDES